MSFLLSDRPYNAEEDVARQQKKKDAEIKKLEEAAQKLKEGMFTYIYILNKGQCSCMHYLHRVYIQYPCCYSHMHVTLIIMYIYNVVFTLVPCKFVLFVGP